LTISPPKPSPTSEQEIANLVSAYAFRNDDADIGGLGDLFAEAVFTLDGTTANGRHQVEAIASAMIPVGPDGRSATSHEITNLTMVVDDAAGTATARSYWTVYRSVSGTPREALMAGRYADEFERRHGEWRFTRRDATTRWKADA
jgi:hypothetical protein